MLHENNNCFRVNIHVFFNTFQLLKSVQQENVSKYQTRNFVSIAVKCRYRKSNIFKQCFLVRILQRRYIKNNRASFNEQKCQSTMTTT